MSRFKLFAFIALITLAFGVALISDALAGEKVKWPHRKLRRQVGAGRGGGRGRTCNRHL